jgi:hypothetical protein
VSYISSVIQQLYRCKLFRYTILGYDHNESSKGIPPSPELNDYKKYPNYLKIPFSERSSQEYGNLWNALANVFIQLEYNKTEVARIDSILSTYFVNGILVDNNNEGDAGIFLYDLLQSFEDLLEWKHVPNLIRRMFKPISTVRVLCSYCNNEYIKAKDDYIIHISVVNHKTLLDGLDNYTKEKNNLKKCKRCNENTKETVKFIKLPNTLIFRIHRNILGGGDKKLLMEFKFPVDEDLDMSQYVEGEEKSTPSCIYRLAGVVINSGEILNAGRYFSYVREREYPSLTSSDVNVHSFLSSNLSSNSQLPTRFGNWLEYDDKNVSEKSHDIMLKTFFGGRVDAEEEAYNRKFNITDERFFMLTQNAFLLFYERVRPFDIYTKEEREIQRNHSDLIAPSYPILALSECHRVAASNIESSLINKCYHNFLKPDIINNDKHFYWNNIIFDILYDMLRSLFDDLKLKEFVEKQKYSPSEQSISFDNSIYDVSSLDRQAPWIWIWIQYLFTIFIHRSDANNKFNYFLKELDEMLITKRNNIKLPILLYFLCNYFLSTLNKDYFTEDDRNEINIKQRRFLTEKLLMYGVNTFSKYHREISVD